VNVFKEVLPPLREELTLYPGPRGRDGAHSWTIHDPPRNAFFSISWLEFEILSRWAGNDPNNIVEAVNRETALNIADLHIHSLLRFLTQNNLIVSRGQAAAKNHSANKAGMRTAWTHWLVKNYLFFRIPLLNPERFLAKTYPFIQWVFSPFFAVFLLAVSGTGLYLISRQWDVFLNTFTHFISFKGFVSYAFAITFCKIIHELSHAYTAKRFGCRVPTIGVAFIVLWPVLYTDTTEAWKLSSHKKRLAISGAGIIAETSLAALALLLWNVLPDGTFRSAAFVIATSAWMVTLVINLNPFMRFDGYYLLSDLLQEPNLQTRAFRLGKWWLREQLFGLDQPCPGTFSRSRRNLLIIYAFGTWLYRFFLFLGIALLVYKLFFKFLGIVLFVVEVGYFIALPIFREFLSWWTLRKEIRFKRETLATFSALFLLMTLFVIPWQNSLNLPAIYRAKEESMLFSPFAARVKEMHAKAGMRVSKEQILIELASPDLEYNINRVQREVEVLRWKLDTQSLYREFLERNMVIESELDEALSRLQGLEDEKNRLEIRAPFSGKIAEVSDVVQERQMVSANEPLLLMFSETGARVEAYVNETDLRRIQPSMPAIFYPEDSELPALECRVAEVEETAATYLNSAYLASPYGGAIPAKVEKDSGRIVSLSSVYRLMLTFPMETDAPATVHRGTVRVAVKPESMLRRIWRHIVALIVRESGF